MLRFTTISALLFISVSSLNTKASNPGDNEVVISATTAFGPAALLCGGIKNEAKNERCIYTVSVPTIATMAWAALHMGGVYYAEQVIADRGDMAMLDVDVNGYIQDPVVLEALEMLREELTEEENNLTDAQLIMLIQNHRGNLDSL